MLLFINVFCFGQNNVEEASNILDRKGEVRVLYEVANKSEFQDITQNFITERALDNKLEVYLLPSNFNRFITKYPDFSLDKPTKNSTKANLMAHTVGELTAAWDRYPIYDVYVDMMNDFASDYPDICTLENIGQSVEGRDLLLLKISDNVDTDEIEPEFFYTSTMHGDETTGFVLMLRYIDYLLSNYQSNTKVKYLVDNLEIFINPLSNPDGTYASGNDTICGYCSNRTNANGVDLNRNFTEPREAENPNEWEQENVHMIDFMKSRHIVLSMNFHGGIEVINYPWDFTATRHADDDWFQLISREYADTVHVYSPSTYMDEFQNGITNGWDWYYAGGTRQDYLNFYLHGREVTAEISNTKAPHSSNMPDYWEYNYRSFLNYMKQATYGVHGIVTDGNTGDPVRAFVEIPGHDEDSSQVYSSATLGDYHRMLKAGTYTLNFSANGYDPVSETITIDDFESINLNIQLLPEGTTNYPPDITDLQGTSIDTVEIKLLQDSMLTYRFSVNDPNGDLVTMTSFESLTNHSIPTKINDTTIHVVPEEAYLGIDWIKISVADNGTPILKDSLYLKLNYKESLNTAPQILNEDMEEVDTISISAFMDSIIDFAFNVVDDEQDSTFIASLNSITGHTNVEKIDESSIRITPEAEFVGNEEIKIVVSDTGVYALQDSLILIVQFIEPINHAPRIVNESGQNIDSLYLTSYKDSTIQVQIHAVDPDDDQVKIYEANSLEEIGTTDFDDGELTFAYIPADGYLGEDFIKVIVCDDGNPELYDSVIVVLNLMNYGDNAPVIVNDDGNPVDSLCFQTFEDTSINICLNAYDPDNDNIILYRIRSLTNHGNINRSDTSLCFEYIPLHTFVGLHKFMVTVQDDSEFLLTDSVYIEIDVRERGNNPPVITDAFGNEVDELTRDHFSFEPIKIKMYVSDIDQDQVSICTAVSINNLGEVSNITSTDTSFMYTPKEDYLGLDTLKVVVCDNSYYNLKDSIHYIISIQPEVNQAPIITDETGNAIDTLEVAIFSDSIASICLHAYDPNGDNVAITDVEYISAHGTVAETIYPLCYTYRSDLGFSGIDNYRVIVCDDHNNPLCDSIIVKTRVSFPNTVFNIDDPGWKLYPNPFSNELNIDLGELPQEHVVVRIFSVAGQEIYAKEEMSGRFSINTTSYQPGLYLVVIQSANKVIKVKLIKQF